MNQNQSFEIVIVGGGSAGIAVCASLLKRDPSLNIAIIEPSEFNYYQPAWTLVGAGEYNSSDTKRSTKSVIPKGATWIKASVVAFEAEKNRVQLDNMQFIQYQYLIVATGLQLNWSAIEGLEATLGKNGVTSNYRFDLAPYTWQLVSSMSSGKAIFTQPPMPIKCAGAPQKAMYLSCSDWEQRGVLNQFQVELHNAGGALFGVAAFVPSLMKYVERYKAKLCFQSKLVQVDGAKKTAWFETTDAQGNSQRIEKPFDLLHVVPPQSAPDVIKNSHLADAQGWCEVDHHTLQHPRFSNVFAIGDVCSAPNAKTMAAARKQAVIVAKNVLSHRAKQDLSAHYDGYGACPLTVEKGKIILAEFGYAGKLLPTFPLDPMIARRSYWHLKKSIMPQVYWNGMLKGKEWLTSCETR
jgi:sulfide:quinone oxidoreductase